MEFSLPATAERAKAALDKMRHGAPPKRMTVAEKKEEERRLEVTAVDGVAGPSASLEQAVAGAAGSGAAAKVPVPCERAIRTFLPVAAALLHVRTSSRGHSSQFSIVGCTRMRRRSVAGADRRRQLYCCAQLCQHWTNMTV